MNRDAEGTRHHRGFVNVKRETGSMTRVYAVILFALNVGTMSSMPAQLKAGTAPRTADRATASGLHDFDFLAGDWRVHHHYLRLKDTRREWLEYDGTCRNHQLMNGQVNMDEHKLKGPSRRPGGSGERFSRRRAPCSLETEDGRRVGGLPAGNAASGETPSAKGATDEEGRQEASAQP